MASNIPNTIALRSDEVGSVLDRTDLIELKVYEISHTISWYKEDYFEANEIKSPFSNRVSLSWRIRDLGECVRRLEVVMESGEGMGTNIWTTMGEQSDTEPPAGVDVAIYDRVDRLRTSVEILRKILERSEQGDVASNILPSTSHKAVELEGQFLKRTFIL